MNYSDLVKKNVEFDNSKRSEAYFKAIFKENLEFGFDDSTQTLAIESPYKNLVVSEFRTDNREGYGDQVTAVLTSPGRDKFSLFYSITVPKEEMADGTKYAIAKSIENFCNAFRTQNLTEDDLIAGLNGNTPQEWKESIIKLAQGAKTPVAALVEFTSEKNQYANLRIARARLNIAKDPALLSVSDITNRYCDVTPDSSTSPIVGDTPSLQDATPTDDLPF